MEGSSWAGDGGGGHGGCLISARQKHALLLLCHARVFMPAHVYACKALPGFY